MKGERRRGVTLPIFSCKVLEQTASRAPRVFCPERQVSVDVRECVPCERCHGVEAKAGGSLVRCAARPVEVQLVGECLHGLVVCVGEDTNLAYLRDVLRSANAHFVVVVSGDLRPAGIIWADQAPLHGLNANGAKTARDAMLPAVTLSEDAPLRRALSTLALARARIAPVVTHDGTLVAVLRDVDALHHLATRER